MMLNYTITEEMRRELLHLLEWAEWSIAGELEKGYPVEADHAACGWMWDMLNALQPVDDECGTGE